MKKFSYSIEERFTPRHKFILSFCGNLSGKNVLDIGCSFGWLEKMAIEQGVKEIIGIEPNEKSFHNIKEINPKVKYVIGRAESLPFNNNSFDIVIMLEVLEHIPKGTEEIAFIEIYRVLKPGGKLILSTPNDKFINSMLDPAWFFGHRHYRPSYLKKILNKSGYKIEKEFLYGGFWEMFRMIPHYFFKWVFQMEDPFKSYFEKKIESDSKKKGYACIYISAIKTNGKG